ncbi:MAG: zinc ribbon domain-containing protein, partial [Waterburya sp.]
CDRCIYDQDDSCNFPQRPYAKSCTLFHDAAKPLIPDQVTPTSQMGWAGIKNWFYRYRALIAIAILIVLSVFLALR